MKIDGRKSRKLTPNQLRFVHEYCYHTLTGKQSASESARKAGYSEKIARRKAYELTEEEKHYSAAINAEGLRGKASGLYDPTIRMESAIENLSREQLVAKLDELQRKGVGVRGEEDIIDVTPEKEKLKMIKD